MEQILAITTPVFLAMSVGYATARAGWFSRADMRVFGRFVMGIALPALLFNALSRQQPSEVFNPQFVVAYALGSFASMMFGLWWARRVLGHQGSASAIFGMGVACSNSGFVGFPLVLQLFGAHVAATCLALAMIVENFFLIPLALALAEMDSSGGDSARRGAWSRASGVVARSLSALVRNPMIIGISLGFSFSVLGWELPEPVARTVDLFAGACAALSLFVIGGTLGGEGPRGRVVDAWTIAAGKLVVHPLAVLGVLWFLPPMAREFQVAVVVMAAVPMMGIYSILAQAHGHEAMAARAQLVTTLASFFTLNAVVWWVKTLA